MSVKFGTQVQISLLFYTTINIIVFTAAVYAVTIFPPLERDAGFWLAAFMAASLILTAPFGWCLGRCILPNAWRKKILAEQSPRAGEPTRPV